MAPVVLIGSNGAVGRRLQRAWKETGTAHLCVGRAAAADLRWDMRAPAPSCPGARGAGVVVLAGVTPLSGGDLADNTRLAQAGIAAARQWGAARVFMVSSSSVYGPTPRSPVDERAPTVASGSYAQAKLAMERATAGPGITALRLANVAGASQPFLAIRAGGARLDAFADAPDAPTRSFIGPVALADCLAALCRAACDGVDLPAVLNVAARDPVPMLDVFDAAGVAPVRVPAPPGAIAHANLDTARLGRFWDVPIQDARALWSECHATDMPAP